MFPSPAGPEVLSPGFPSGLGSRGEEEEGGAIETAGFRSPLQAVKGHHAAAEPGATSCPAALLAQRPGPPFPLCLALQRPGGFELSHPPAAPAPVPPSGPLLYCRAHLPEPPALPLPAGARAWVTEPRDGFRPSDPSGTALLSLGSQ